MPKGLLSNRLNAFQESELAFENSGVGSNGLRSSRIRKTKKIMNVKSTTAALDLKKNAWGLSKRSKTDDVEEVDKDVDEEVDVQEEKVEKVEKKKAKVNAWGISEAECANPSIGRFGTCGPGAAYRVPKKRCSRQAVCRQMQQASDFSGGGIEFDAQVSCWNTNVPTRRCCAPVLDIGASNYRWSN